MTKPSKFTTNRLEARIERVFAALNAEAQAAAEDIGRRWAIIASYADVARHNPRHNMEAYIVVERELAAIKQAILNMPVDDFARTLNRK